MASSLRQRKISDAIKRELANVINTDVRDPDKGFISITNVRVSPDLGIAYVYITVFGEENQEEKSLAVLEKASGFLRNSLARVLKSRKVPHLKFFIDDTLDYFNRIGKTMDEIKSEKKSNSDHDVSEDSDE